MACDLWLVPLVDILCHTPDNPFAEELAQYDKVLAEAGLPPVPVYPYMPGLSGEVAPVAGFDYDALHFLRRAYLLQVCGLPVSPVDELGGDYEQLLEMFESTAQQSHLVWHYDHAGAYVPVDFPHPSPATNSWPEAALWAPRTPCCGNWRPSPRPSASTPPTPGATGGTARPDGAGGARRSRAVRRESLLPRAARLAGTARGGHPEPGPGVDDRVQLIHRRAPRARRAVSPVGRAPSPGPRRS